MVFVYISLGLFLIIKGWQSLTRTQNYGIGVLLLLYAIFRIIRIVKDTGMNESDDEL
jgi:hypothetical protein